MNILLHLYHWIKDLELRKPKLHKYVEPKLRKEIFILESDLIDLNAKDFEDKYLKPFGVIYKREAYSKRIIYLHRGVSVKTDSLDGFWLHIYD